MEEDQAPMILYRVLRRVERYENGLRAKNPEADVTIETHVGAGSYSGRQSQYISTCGSLEAARQFASRSVDKPKTIVKITLTWNTPDVEVVDLRDRATLARHVPRDNVAATNFARKFEEVLIIGHVPASCVEFQEMYEGCSFNSRTTTLKFVEVISLH